MYTHPKPRPLIRRKGISSVLGDQFNGFVYLRQESPQDQNPEAIWDNFDDSMPGQRFSYLP